MTPRKFALAVVIAIGIAVGSVLLLVIGVIVAATISGGPATTRKQPAAESTEERAIVPSRAAEPEPASTTAPARPSSGLTYENYLRLKEGMTYAEVVEILGTTGEELSRSDIAGYTTVMYSWQKWTGANMNAMFQNGRLVTKAQFGLR